MLCIGSCCLEVSPLQNLLSTKFQNSIRSIRKILWYIVFNLLKLLENLDYLQELHNSNTRTYYPPKNSEHWHSSSWPAISLLLKKKKKNSTRWNEITARKTLLIRALHVLQPTNQCCGSGSLIFCQKYKQILEEKNYFLTNLTSTIKT